MTTQPDFDTMTDAELATTTTPTDNPLGDGTDLEDIEVEVAHPLSVPMSFRLPPQEASVIRASAGCLPQRSTTARNPATKRTSRHSRTSRSEE